MLNYNIWNHYIELSQSLHDHLFPDRILYQWMLFNDARLIQVTHWRWNWEVIWNFDSKKWRKITVANKAYNDLWFGQNTAQSILLSLARPRRSIRSCCWWEMLCWKTAKSWKKLWVTSREEVVDEAARDGLMTRISGLVDSLALLLTVLVPLFQRGSGLVPSGRCRWCLP